MLPRERIMENERLTLSEFACLSQNSRGRKTAEEPCPFRTDFQRDRDRIIHCNAFQRLKHKTQVFLIPHGDHYRTRLTHTLEVSQIARTIACALALNEDLCEAIALGHDLGHTPFGHDGERALNELMSVGFAHNEQSRRVVDVIEKNGRGLNLTAEVIDGIVNHRGESQQPLTREGCIVKLSDKIAYVNHDIEDAIRAGVITADMIPDFTVKTLGDTKSKRITALVSSIVEHGAEKIAFDEETKQAFTELREFMFEKVYRAKPTVAERGKATDIVKYLYNYFYNNKDKMPALYNDIAERESLEIAVGDFVSGMTDEYAVDYFERLCIPKGWTIV